MIPMDKCEKGGIYKITARNFAIGVYDGDQGFLGIRTKFGNRFIDREFHWDQGVPHGTVQPQEKIGQVPDGTDLRAVHEVVERECTCGHPSGRHERECMHTSKWGPGHCSVGCLDCQCTCFDGKRYMTGPKDVFEILEKLGG